MGELYSLYQGFVQFKIVHVCFLIYFISKETYTVKIFFRITIEISNQSLNIFNEILDQALTRKLLEVRRF